MPIRLTPILLLAATVVQASVKPASHSDARGGRLSSRWYHEEDHPVYSLFRRAGISDGIAYAAIGTSNWSAGFPANLALTVGMPQAWIDALNSAVAAGKIPDIPVSTGSETENPTYPAGFDPYSAAVCSSTYKCAAQGDVWDAPPGVIGLSFDDGPLPASSTLYKFLRDNNERATHFFIGQNILSHPQAFQEAVEVNGDDVAIHTWTHPFMTTKTNLEVLGELGWTMWLVHNSTGGRLPRFWRPPYGDCDMRVRAIAKEVFGLTTVIWNQDTNDWTLDQKPPGTTAENISLQMQAWLTGPKTPGLVILEHELTDSTVASFMNAYPLMVSNGWTRVSLTQMDGLGSYQNALNSTSPVTPARVGDLGVKPPQATTSQAQTPTASGPSSVSSSPHTSGTPHANQKSGAEHFTSAASLVLSGIAILVAAVAGSVVL